MSDSQINALLAHYRLHNRNAITHVIRSAVSLGIIAALAEGQKTVDQLAEQLELQVDPLSLLMKVLVETELVEQYGDDFALSTVARLIPRELRDFGDFHWSHLGRFYSQWSQPFQRRRDPGDRFRFPGQFHSE